MELYRKVIIKSEDDLPKGDGNYLVHNHGVGSITFIPFYKVVSEGDIVTGGNKHYWIENIDWYLLPIEICTCGGYPDCICDITKAAIKQKEIIKALSGEPIEDVKTVTSTEYEQEPRKEIAINTPFFGNSGAEIPMKEPQYCQCTEPDREIGYDYCNSCHRHVSPQRIEYILNQGSTIEQEPPKEVKSAEEWFNNHSDCFADTWHSERGFMQEGQVIPALTLGAFLDFASQFTTQRSDQRQVTDLREELIKFMVWLDDTEIGTININHVNEYLKAKAMRDGKIKTKYHDNRTKKHKP